MGIHKNSLVNIVDSVFHRIIELVVQFLLVEELFINSYHFTPDFFSTGV